MQPTVISLRSSCRSLSIIAVMLLLVWLQVRRVPCSMLKLRGCSRKGNCATPLWLVYSLKTAWSWTDAPLFKSNLSLISPWLDILGSHRLTVHSLPTESTDHELSYPSLLSSWRATTNTTHTSCRSHSKRTRSHTLVFQ